jgi:hypothetical protein
MRSIAKSPPDYEALPRVSSGRLAGPFGAIASRRPRLRTPWPSSRVVPGGMRASELGSRRGDFAVEAGVTGSIRKNRPELSDDSSLGPGALAMVSSLTRRHVRQVVAEFEALPSASAMRGKPF